MAVNLKSVFQSYVLSEICVNVTLRNRYVIGIVPCSSIRYYDSDKNLSERKNTVNDRKMTTGL